MNMTTRNERRRWGARPDRERSSLLSGLLLLEVGSLLAALGVGAGFFLFGTGSLGPLPPGLGVPMLGIALLLLGGSGLLGISVGLFWIGRGPSILRNSGRWGGICGLGLGIFLLFDMYRVVALTFSGRIPGAHDDSFLSARMPLVPVWLGVSLLVLGGLSLVNLAQWSQDRNVYRGGLMLVILTGLVCALVTGVLLARTGQDSIPVELQGHIDSDEWGERQEKEVQGAGLVCFAAGVLLAAQFIVGRRARFKVKSFPLYVKTDTARRTKQDS
jgi:hypothetical protein